MVVFHTQRVHGPEDDGAYEVTLAPADFAAIAAAFDGYKGGATPRQVQVVALIAESMDTCGYAPTMEELARTLGVSKVTVFEHLQACAKKGLVVNTPRMSRSHVPTERGRRAIRGLWPVPRGTGDGGPDLRISTSKDTD